jgi:cytochrome P450
MLDGRRILKFILRIFLEFNKMAAAVEQILGEGWNVNNSDAVTSNDPEKIYKEWNYLRSNCPVAKVDRHCPDGYWLMTRYEDIKNCASDSDTFISRVHAVVPSGKSSWS